MALEFTCGQCRGTGMYVGSPCGLCGGDGRMELTDEKIASLDVGTQKRLLGMVWSEIFNRLTDIEDKVDDVIDKCNDIFEKVNE